MNLIKKSFLVSITLIISHTSFAQEWYDLMSTPGVNFYEVQKSFYKDWENKTVTKGNGYKQFKRMEWFLEPRVYPTGSYPKSNIPLEEKEKFDKIYGKNQQLSKTSSWRPLGPTHWNDYGYSPGLGRINQVRVDPNDTNTIYVCTPSGGLWKTTDGGLNWNPLTDNLPVIGVTDILINPKNSNELFISTGDGIGGTTYSIGIFKSTDGGQTWSNANFAGSRTQNLRMRKMLMHPIHTDTIWVATNRGLWRTDNGGNTWRNVLDRNSALSQNEDIRSVKMHPTDTSIVYACTDQFYRSTDGGNTFVPSNNGLNMNQPGNINRMEIAVSPDSADVVYAVCGDQSDGSFYGLYRSNDAGQNFQLMSDTPNIFTYSPIGVGAGGQSGYDLAIAVNPNNADDVFIGGINVWRSTDGGANWNIKSHWVSGGQYGYTHADIHSLEFYNGSLFCGSDGGIFKTDNLGNNWTDLSEGLEITQFYRISVTEQNDTSILGGAQDNGSLFLTDSNRWAHVFGADGMYNAIDPSNSQILYYSSQNGSFYRSYNGGVSESGISGSIRSSESGAWETPFQIDPSNNFNLFAAYQNVWYSTNRGASWNAISSFNSSNTLRTLEVAPSNSNVIYTAPLSNQIKRTTNRGASWTWINNGLPNLAINDIEVHPSYPDSVWITFSGFTPNRKVYVSGDGGLNWQNISANLPNLPVNTIAIDTVTGIEYVGTDVGVYYRDLSVSPFWQSYMQSLPNVIVNDLQIHYRSSTLKAGTYGRGIWEANLVRPNITSVKSTEILKESDFALYPNPNKGQFVIEDQKMSIEQIEIFNPMGKMVYSMRTSPKTIHEINLGSVSNGFYLIRMRNSNLEVKQAKILIRK